MDRWLVAVKGAAEQARRFAAIEKKVGINWVPQEFWRHGDWLDQLSGWKIVKEYPGKTIFDLCLSRAGWIHIMHQQRKLNTSIERLRNWV
ncbi:MAG: hypothetical protein R3B66_00125 [Candidatus Scalinduaceae bacterium]